MSVTCNQTGKIMPVPINTLSKENGEPVFKEKLRAGDQLLYEFKNKAFDVTFKAANC